MLSNCSVFSHLIHEQLSCRVSRAMTLNAHRGFLQAYMGTRAASALRLKKKRPSTGDVADTSVGGRSNPNILNERKSIFGRLNEHGDRKSGTNQPEAEPYNYYDIKDAREEVPSPGFESWDPRSRMSNRDDATEDIELESILSKEEVNTSFSESSDAKVKLNRTCVVTKREITVDVPVKQLTGKEIVSALLYAMPVYAKNVSVESLYRELYDRGEGAGVHCDDATLKLLEGQICLVSRAKILKAREAVIISMLYDRKGMLEPELRDSLSVAMQYQLYAFRPYDVAATVTVFSKYGSRYTPLLNTLGLVFYDLMMGGPTSPCPKGPSIEETIDVLKAYARAQLPIKRVIDAGFGRAYDSIDIMTKSQMITLLESFFALSQDPNYVEMYTKILSKVLNHPLLFIDSFQEWAEECLRGTGHPEITTREMIEDSLRDSPREIWQLLSALSSCKSEFLIQSVHSRIAFKRLWRDNIVNGIMPWQGPVVPPMVTSGQLDPKGSLALPEDGHLNVNSGPTGGRVTGPTVESDVRHFSAKEEGAVTVVSKDNVLPKMLSYLGQMPCMYMSIVNMITVVLEFLPQPCEYLTMIHKENSDVMQSVRNIFKEHGRDMSAVPLFPCYPFMATLYQYAVSCKAAEPMFNKMRELRRPSKGDTGDHRLSKHSAVHTVKEWHVRRLVKAQTKEEDSEPLDVSKLDKTALIEECLDSISLGNSGKIESCFNVLDLEVNGLANAISVVADFSRYSDDQIQETLSILGALYFRILFAEASGPGGNGCATAFTLKKLLETISPRSLLMDCPHLPFTLNPALLGDTHFHKVGYSKYMFHRPSPLYADLFSGNSYLYGLMLYAMAQKMQFLIAEESTQDESIQPGIHAVAKAVQHALHPFFAVKKLDSHPIMKMSILYYTGDLSKYDDLVKMIDETTGVSSKNGSVTNSVGATQPPSEGGDPQLHRIYKMIEDLLQRVTGRVVSEITKVTRCQYFRHVAYALINVSMEYMKRPIEEASGDWFATSLKQYAEMSIAISMLLEFEAMVSDSHGPRLGEALMQLRNQATGMMCKVIKSMGMKAENNIMDFDCLSIRDRKGHGDRSPMGIPEIVENLSEQMDSETFLRSIEALALCSNLVHDDMEYIAALHAMTHVMYKRMPFMSHRELVRTAGIIVDLSKATIHALSIDMEDPRGQLAQMVLILRNKWSEILDQPMTQVDDEEVIHPLGRWELSRWLS